MQSTVVLSGKIKYTELKFSFQKIHHQFYGDKSKYSTVKQTTIHLKCVAEYSYPLN